MMVNRSAIMDGLLINKLEIFDIVLRVIRIDLLVPRLQTACRVYPEPLFSCDVRRGRGLQTAETLFCHPPSCSWPGSRRVFFQLMVDRRPKVSQAFYSSCSDYLMRRT